jgi:hypothetical protein
MKLLKEYENVTQKVLFFYGMMNLETVIRGILNCKLASLVDFCGLLENASWIISTSPSEVFGLPAPFRCRTLPVS